MKKRIALFVMSMFVLGCFTQAFAEENNAPKVTRKVHKSFFTQAFAEESNSAKKDLANSEVKVNKNTLIENSPLVKAIRSLDLAKVKQAVAKGANVNGRLNDENNFTPLHVLATIPQDAQKAEKAKQITDFLIAQGADVNARAKKGETPLHIALFKNNTEMSKFLVDKGADIHARTNSCEAPIHNVRSKEMLDFLVSKAEGVGSHGYKATHDCMGQIFLHYAAERGDLEVVKSVVGIRIYINAESLYGVTPLSLAARNGKIDVVKFLVENEADVNSKESLYPPLQAAILSENMEIVKFLISKGADVNMENFYIDYTPLTLAVDKDNVKIVKLLLDNGADVNKTDGLRLPLDYAKNEKMRKLLIKYGAKQEKNSKGIDEEGL